ncbi:hypothetical protein CRYUN_Cryun24cG0028200 [Craigia yunnanensis]
MEIFSSKSITLLLLLLLLLTTNTVTNADLTSQELDAALLALRSSGYTLFPNAITTSDLHLRLLSPENSSFFTLFAPPDSLLFSLDLLSSARLYTFSLLHHVSPHFLSRSDLLSLPRPAYIETLLPNYRQLFVENTRVSRNGTVLLSVTVDGVGVSVPDLFLGSNIAVHGLDGILITRYGPRNITGTDFGEAPKSWCEMCISPANPPESLPPMGSGVPEDVTLDSGIKKDGGSDHDDDRGTTKRARHGTFFRFKRLFTR